MKKLIVISLIIFPVLSSAQDFTGEWKGAYIVNAQVEKLNLYVNTGRSDSATIDALETNRYNLSYAIASNDDSLVLSRRNVRGKLVQFKGVVVNDSFIGTVVSNNKNIGLFQFMKSSNKLFKGEQLPDFTITAVSNEAITNSTFTNKYYLLDFWATWCKPCVAKRPKLEELKSQMGERLDIFSISLDKEWSTVEQFRENQFAMPWKHAIEPLQWNSPFIEAFAPVGLPYGYLVDKTGKIIAVGDELNSDKLLKTAKRLVL